MCKHAVSRFVALLLVLGTLLLVSPLGVAQPASPPAAAPEAPLATGWQVFPATAVATMYALDMVSETDGWAGGVAGFLARYNGSDWVPVQAEPSSPMQGLDMTSASTGWGVTFHGHILRYNGSTWAIHSRPVIVPGDPPKYASLDDIYMLDDANGWAVGSPVNSVATILRCVSGTWSVAASPTSYWLRAIDMVDATHGYIVGVGGTVLRWDGAAWSGGSVAPGVLFLDVDAVSATDVWAVGGDMSQSGVIYHYNGTNWLRVATPPVGTLHAVAMLSATNGWAAGASGAILHYNGSTWQAVSSPTGETIEGISMLNPGSGWAIASSGVYLRYIGVPDLSTSTKNVSPRYAAPGGRLTYTIRVANTGEVAAAGVTVTDPVPANATYVNGSATTTQGTIQPPSGGQPLVVNVGTIAPGGVVTINFQVDAGNPGAACWFVTNQATIVTGTLQWTRAASTTMGDCNTILLPGILRSY